MKALSRRALLFPLENVRSRLQVQRRKKTVDLRDESISSDEPVPDRVRRPYKGGLDCIARVIHEEGWRELYRGLRAALIGVSVSSCVYFFCMWKRGSRLPVDPWHLTLSADAGYSLFKRAWIQHTASKYPTALANMGLAMAAGSLNALVSWASAQGLHRPLRSNLRFRRQRCRCG